MDFLMISLQHHSIDLYLIKNFQLFSNKIQNTSYLIVDLLQPLKQCCKKIFVTIKPLVDMDSNAFPLSHNLPFSLFSIGRYGAEAILAGLPGDGQTRILTHCNTGSLATAGYGTALGVVRKLHELKKLEHIYCTETRPYNQVRMRVFIIKISFTKVRFFFFLGCTFNCIRISS